MTTTPKRFLDEDFLLDTATAVDLYQSFAKPQPIIDYHCHLSPDYVADDHRFADLTEIWLAGDHYKWRAMRAAGVPERAITGDATAWEKFAAWAATVPQTLRNPLYHWTHLELQFPFGIRDQRLGPDTARAIFDACNAKLASDGFTAQGLLRQFQVRIVCSTDDPTDTLDAHRRHAANPAATTRLLPTYRPDAAIALSDLPTWNAWVDKLEAVADQPIGSFAALIEALRKRHDAFHAAGCRSSDHGLARLFAAAYTPGGVEAAFAKARAGRPLDPTEIDQVSSAALYELGLLDHARGWVQQFHLGALRDTNTRALGRLGPNTGYDSVGDLPQAATLVRFLDRLDREDRLAKTIIYNLNPADNEVFATAIGSFQDGITPGKIQLGSAWWFLDQLDGIVKQLDALSQMGLLARFVGMLTDSRSFLSYSRHDYFRRILCNLLGGDVEKGRLPHDRALLGDLVANVCFHNAERYFQFS